MSDLVQRLRSRVITLHCMGADEVYPDKTAHEAADEIERLERELAEVKAAGYAGVLQKRLERAEQCLRDICAVDKATPGRKDCWIWADMLEIAASYFSDRGASK